MFIIYRRTELIESFFHHNSTLKLFRFKELIGIGRFHSIALLTTGLCFMADSMEITLLAFLSYTLKDEWGLTSTRE